MATKDKSTESVYRVTEVIGTSAQSWEDAAKTAVETAAGTLRDLRIAEVVKMDVKIEDGKVTEYRTRLQLSFKYEGEFARGRISARHSAKVVTALMDNKIPGVHHVAPIASDPQRSLDFCLMLVC